MEQEYHVQIWVSNEQIADLITDEIPVLKDGQCRVKGRMYYSPGEEADLTLIGSVNNVTIMAVPYKQPDESDIPF